MTITSIKYETQDQINDLLSELNGKYKDYIHEENDHWYHQYVILDDKSELSECMNYLKLWVKYGILQKNPFELVNEIWVYKPSFSSELFHQNATIALKICMRGGIPKDNRENQ